MKPLERLIDAQLLQQIFECFRRIKMQHDFAFFLIAGFDFGINAQMLGQCIIDAADIRADGLAASGLAF